LFGVSPNVYGAVGCFAVGHACAWFQLNSQFIWEWWKNKPLLSVSIYALPIGLFFWLGTKLMYQETGELWAGRFVGFAASYFIFPLLTWWLHHESPFTAKTLTCIFLSVLILMVQIFWK
tara:strand:- start:110 stop:466 length:357 start_codon:yes stop_codon:yes gene_type:complete